MKEIEKITLGISSCLLGEKVRFDGGHKKDDYINKTLSHFFSFEPFCPEVAIGLGIPRPTIRLQIDPEKTDNKDIVRCVNTKEPDKDFTSALEKAAEDRTAIHSKISGYILKRASPSCGMERVKVYKNGMPLANGRGIFARRLLELLPNLPVEEEGRLCDPVIRENFIHRVIVYNRWQRLTKNGPSLSELTEFHGRHKLVLMSHHQDKMRLIGKKLAKVTSDNLKEFLPEYFDELMEILRIKATPKNHVNTLQHIQGYLKKQLSADAKAELNETIEQYRLGYLPLIVPITLLRHHFRSFTSEYINRSYYMQPHPKELMLLNSL